LATAPFLLLDAARSGLLGGLCAIILILVAGISEGGQPPIAISIEDFWGGVIVGLFSLPIATWIVDKVGLTGALPVPPIPKSSAPGKQLDAASGKQLEVIHAGAETREG